MHIYDLGVPATSPLQRGSMGHCIVSIQKAKEHRSGKIV